MENDFPAPTPRTKHSPAGMNVWEKACEVERKESRRENYKSPMKRGGSQDGDIIVPGAYLAFDHKVWSDTQQFVWWYPPHVKFYYWEDIPEAEPNEAFGSNYAEEFVTKFDTFGG